MSDIKSLIATATPEELKELLDQMSTAEVREALGQLEPADFPLLIQKTDETVLQALAGEISTPGELKQLLDLSGDDTVINDFLAKAGVDAMLDRVFSLMGTRFLPERVGNETGAVEWHVGTPDGQKVYHLTIADGRAEGSRGPAERARTTLTISGPDMLRLCAGTLDGISGFMAGKIKLAGDMIFGAKLPTAFNTAA